MNQARPVHVSLRVWMERWSRSHALDAGPPHVGARPRCSILFMTCAALAARTIQFRVCGVGRRVTQEFTGRELHRPRAGRQPLDVGRLQVDPGGGPGRVGRRPPKLWLISLRHPPPPPSSVRLTPILTHSLFLYRSVPRRI